MLYLQNISNVQMPVNIPFVFCVHIRPMLQKVLDNRHTVVPSGKVQGRGLSAVNISAVHNREVGGEDSLQHASGVMQKSSKQFIDRKITRQKIFRGIESHNKCCPKNSTFLKSQQSPVSYQIKTRDFFVYFLV